MDDCICCAYDGRGRSCCGHECPTHPLDGICPKCQEIKTHDSVKCIMCAYEDGEE